MKTGSPKILLKNPATSAKWVNCPVRMRGQQEPHGSLFSCVAIEERIPSSQPLWRIRRLAAQALDRLNPTFFDLYASHTRSALGAA
jgi:hypothetical protein